MDPAIERKSGKAGLDISVAIYLVHLAMSSRALGNLVGSLPSHRSSVGSISSSHCLDLDLNGKRSGVTSDGNFSSYLIGRS